MEKKNHDLICKQIMLEYRTEVNKAIEEAKKTGTYQEGLDGNSQIIKPIYEKYLRKAQRLRKK